MHKTHTHTHKHQQQTRFKKSSNTKFKFLVIHYSHANLTCLLFVVVVLFLLSAVSIIKSEQVGNTKITTIFVSFASSSSASIAILYFCNETCVHIRTRISSFVIIISFWRSTLQLSRTHTHTDISHILPSLSRTTSFLHIYTHTHSNTLLLAY